MVSDTTPAMVLGSGVNGLGVSRSLARAGVPVWLLDTDVRRPEMYTHAARALQIGALHGEALVDELVRLSESRFAGLRPVLFLTQEESVVTVSNRRGALANRYRFCLPLPEIVQALQHKYDFQRLAEQAGAPIPKSIRVCSSVDLQALETLQYPVVVKPGARNAEYSHQFKKAYRVETCGQAVTLVRQILPVMSDVLVQEWTEGPDSNIYFCLQYLDPQGQVTAAFTGRKVRSWPPQVGGTASCVPAPEAHAELSATTGRFFRSVGVMGMAAMEYKRDARNGQFRMVEPTISRTDYQAEVATLNGVNLPYAAYCDALGIRFPEPVPVRQPVAWRVRSQDVQSAVAQQQRPSQGFSGVAAVVDALWRSSDPRPCLVQILRRTARALHSRTAKLMIRSRASGDKPCA